jgi:hypothetical protein
LSPKFEALGARQGRREMLEPLLSAPSTNRVVLSMK